MASEFHPPFLTPSNLHQPWSPVRWQRASNSLLYDRSPQLLHPLPPQVPPAISESPCTETQQYCRVRAFVAGRFGPSKLIRGHLSGTWRLAWTSLPAAEWCSSLSAWDCKGTRLVLPFANRLLQIQEMEVCRKLETASLRATNAPNQSCGEYARPWL